MALEGKTPSQAAQLQVMGWNDLLKEAIAKNATEIPPRVLNTG